MNIVLLFDEGEPIDFADSMIVRIVTVLEVSVSSLNVTVNEVFLVSLFNPLHFIGQAKEKSIGEHLLVHEIVDPF